MIEAIIAMGCNGEVGFEDGLPWPNNPEDMKWFKEITMGKVCVVGHNTAKTLPYLRGRTVIKLCDWETPEDLIELFQDLIIIGGPKTYKLWESYIDRYYISRIRGNYPADTYFKEWAPWLKNT